MRKINRGRGRIDAITRKTMMTIAPAAPMVMSTKTLAKVVAVAEHKQQHRLSNRKWHRPRKWKKAA